MCQCVKIWLLLIHVSKCSDRLGKVLEPEGPRTELRGLWARKSGAAAAGAHPT